jgi:predicted HTH domain antitoxin
VTQHLAAAGSNVDAAAKEAVIVELYRRGQISHGALAECLGLSRHEADALLGRHHVTEDLLNLAEYGEQMRALRARLAP